ncbi:DNA-directed DNA polymerase, partial [Cryomyces antarcticus]
FTAFAADLSAQSLESLIEVLDQRENLAGQQALFEQEADQAENPDAEDVEDTSDVEMVDGAPHKASNEDGDAVTNGGSSDDSSGDDDDAENGSADDGDQGDEELEMKLAELLKTAANGAGSDSSDGDADMDDEEMMALEPHLTKIFEERKKLPNKKKEGRDAKETVINFKNRVLDLLAIYVKQQHANPLALNLILP